MHPAALALALLASALLGACEAGYTPISFEALGDAGETRTGRIALISLRTNNTFGLPDAPVEVSGQFVEYEGISDASVRHALDMWGHDDAPQRGECLLRDTARSTAPRDPWLTHIELLNAGDLVIEGPLDTVSLNPRPLPSVLPYLGGVTYGTGPTDHLGHLDDGLVALWSSGSEAVPAFDFEIALPAPVTIEALNGVTPGSATTLSLPFEDGLSVRWSADEATADDAGEVFLGFASDAPGDSRELRCAADDSGRFRLGEEALRSLDEGGAVPRALRVTATRLRSVSLTLPGFDEAEVLAVTEHTVLLY